MGNEEAKKIVTAGLERRKIARREAEREEQLEKYERDMIHFVHCSALQSSKDSDDECRRVFVLERKQKAEQMQAMAVAYENARDNAANLAVKRYMIACLIILQFTTWTYLPMWGAITLAVSLAVFPVAYIYRLFFLNDFNWNGVSNR